MIVFLEVSGPFLWRPFYYESRIMYRVGWGFFALAWLRVSMHEYATTDFQWNTQ